MNKGFSVIICCFNSERRISETLSYVFQLRTTGLFSFEVIVVNNNSTDDTAEEATRAEKIFNKAGVEFKIVNENIPGLSAARKRGLAESSFEFILYCDDDNHLDESYLLSAKEVFDSDPVIGIAGGWCKPKFKSPGKWIESNYFALAVEKHPRVAGYTEWVFGAGMVLRRQLFERLKERELTMMLSDRVGKKQTSGGDAELCMLATFIGYKIFYSPQMQLFHAISQHRLTKRAFIKGNYKNVFPLIYLYLMTELIKKKKQPPQELYKNYFRERVKMLFYFFPRLAIGKFRFYSFIMFFQNLQLLYWLLLRRKRFINTYNEIQLRLYRGSY
jgi:glycosyltransferase involved in cell wall biosynthesis